MIALKLKKIGKCFDILDKDKGIIQNFLLNIRLSNNAKFWALKNISFCVKKGECIGVIGDNGSGKSTLLKIISGITMPSEGDVKINGKLNSFLELGVGFQGELSGKENIFFYGSLLGLKKEYIKKVYKHIINFSGLEEVVEQPVKTYSSGMLARLAFSVISFTNSDIMLFDEVLSVGDHSFKQKSLSKLLEFKRKGKTILIASHNADELLKICDKCILLEKGCLGMFGDAKNVIEAYVTKINQKNKLKLINQIKEEESKDCGSIKLLHLYNELDTILGGMINSGKEKITKRLYEDYDIKELINQCEERVKILEKMISYHNKKNRGGDSKKTYSSMPHESLIETRWGLQELYEYFFDQNDFDERIKKVENYKKQIKILMEAIQNKKAQVDNDYPTMKLYERLADVGFVGLNLSNYINKNEKKLILLDIKRVLKEGLEKYKNSRVILLSIISIIEYLLDISSSKERNALLKELKSYKSRI